MTLVRKRNIHCAQCNKVIDIEKRNVKYLKDDLVTCMIAADSIAVHRVGGCPARGGYTTGPWGEEYEGGVWERKE